MGITWVAWNHLATPKGFGGNWTIGLIYAYTGSQIFIIARHVFKLTTMDIYIVQYFIENKDLTQLGRKQLRIHGDNY